MNRLFAAALACAALLAVPAAASAQQDPWVQQVRAMLQEAGQVFEDEGYEMTHRIYTGSLNDAAEEMVELELDVGKEYQILGACDEDCSDLDITLYDGAGEEVDIDIEADDFPLVSVTVGRSGTFRMKVSMANCSAEPCRYGVGVFGK